MIIVIILITTTTTNNNNNKEIIVILIILLLIIVIVRIISIILITITITMISLILLIIFSVFLPPQAAYFCFVMLAIFVMFMVTCQQHINHMDLLYVMLCYNYLRSGVLLLRYVMLWRVMLCYVLLFAYIISVCYVMFAYIQAAKGKVPVLYYLSGLTCTDDNFTQKACAQRIHNTT